MIKREFSFYDVEEEINIIIESTDVDIDTAFDMIRKDILLGRPSSTKRCLPDFNYIEAHFSYDLNSVVQSRLPARVFG